jgi:hypothetical protein
VITCGLHFSSPSFGLRACRPRPDRRVLGLIAGLGFLQPRLGRSVDRGLLGLLLLPERLGLFLRRRLGGGFLGDALALPRPPT